MPKVIIQEVCFCELLFSRYSRTLPAAKSDGPIPREVFTAVFLQHDGPYAGTPSVADFLSSFSLIGGAERRLRRGHFLTLPCLLIIRQSSYVRKVDHRHRLF